MQKALVDLKVANPSIELKRIDAGHLVTKAWNDQTVSFLFKPKQRLSFLRGVSFPEELVAIRHPQDKMEFIYGPVSRKDPVFERSFTFNYGGHPYKCEYAPITPVLKLLALSFREADPPGPSNYRNLRLLRDYLKDKNHFTKWLGDAEPISFFVSGDLKALGDSLIPFAKALNFYMSYFDRRTPYIQILAKQVPEIKYKRPCYQQDRKFPDVITAAEIDPVLLDILLVARETDHPRLKFVFYFQILEYCAYYHLADNLQNRLVTTFRKPDIAARAPDYVKIVIEDLKDHFSQRDDSAKLEQAICKCCTINELRHELEANIEYFCQDVVFDGGLVLPKLLKDKDCLARLSESDLLKLKKNIEKIRNVLVHLRESRENKVILPTAKNDALLLPYLYCVQRLAENIAVQID